MRGCCRPSCGTHISRRGSWCCLNDISPAIQTTYRRGPLGRVTWFCDVIIMATACSVVMANDVRDGLVGSGGLRGHTATNCVLMTVAVVSICALVVCGVLVVREYSLAMSYLPTDCRLSNITYARHDVACKHCASGGSVRCDIVDFIKEAHFYEVVQ